MAGILNLTSRPSEVKSDFPPHLKINIMVYTNYGKKFMFFYKSAQFLLKWGLSSSTIEGKDESEGNAEKSREMVEIKSTPFQLFK